MATSILNNYQPPARPSDTLTPAIFHGDKLHPEERDRMSLTRISNQVALSLSEIISGEQKELQSYQILSAPAATMEQCKAIAAWAAKAGEPLYLLFGSRGGNVVAHSMQVNDMEKFVIDMELYINSNIPFMLARKNPADFGNLTAMDILSTEAMSRESISAFIDRLIDPKNISGKNRDIYDPRGRGNSMNKKQIMEGKLRLINVTYHSAVLFIQLFGIQLRESQINRKFESIEDFKEHIYRIKPELNELGKKDERYVFERKNGVGMIIECALIRAMDHTYDTLSSDRF